MEKQFWIKWILNYSIGELLAIGVATTIGRLVFVEFSDEISRSPAFVTPLVLVAIGLTEGWVIGYLQWRSLSRLVIDFKRRSWVYVTMIATTLGWVIVIPPTILLVSFFVDFGLANRYYSILYAALAGVCFGSIMGLGQYFILKRFYNNALVWLVSNAIGWMLSFLVVYFCLSFLDRGNSFLYNFALLGFACVLSGLSQGLVTGTALHFLMSVRNAYKYMEADQ